MRPRCLRLRTKFCPLKFVFVGAQHAAPLFEFGLECTSAVAGAHIASGCARLAYAVSAVSASGRFYRGEALKKDRWLLDLSL